MRRKIGSLDIRDLPVIEHAEQGRPSLKARAISELLTNDGRIAAAKRKADLHRTANSTPPSLWQPGGPLAYASPHQYGLDEEGMGWHSCKRFRKTWLRGRRRLEDINNFWMAHKPKSMSELDSHLHEELQVRLDEADRVGFGFSLPETPIAAVVPNVPKLHQNSAVEIAA